MLCRSVYAHGLAAGQKTVQNQDWATGPRSPRAAGPWRAVGPLGRGGPWAAGLLLAKPFYFAPKLNLNHNIYTDDFMSHASYITSLYLPMYTKDSHNTRNFIPYSSLIVWVL